LQKIYTHKIGLIIHKKTIMMVIHPLFLGTPNSLQCWL